MSRLPRFVSVRSVRMVALAAAVATPALLMVGRSVGQDQPATPPATPPAAPAGDAAATPAAPAANPVDAPENAALKTGVENFWHYAKVARYDLATSEGQRVLDMKPDPQLLLSTFERVAVDHHDNLDASMIRWQGVAAVAPVATGLLNVLHQGHDARRADPAYIKRNVEVLAENERGYTLSIDRLRETGELAVPILIDYLRDPAKRQYHPAVRRALRDLGLPAVNPLLACTEMKDPSTLMAVVNVLGDLGYDAAVPYLSRLLASTDTPAEVKASVNDAMRKLRIADPKSVDPAEAYYGLAERFYYDNAAVRVDKKDPVGRVWFWGEQNGLTFTAVPTAIFHDVMAKRAAEYTLRLSNSRDDALSLWLAANYQDEADLPAGQKDPTQPADAPSAHYWGALSGVKYLDQALARANRDRNAPVALRVVQTLQDVTGDNTLRAGTDLPLIDAMQFPDRLVRYEAAFALAAALPKTAFAGQERVVPLLAEALSQTGAANVLVLVQDQAQLNGLVDALKGQGYNVIGATTPEDAVRLSQDRPAIDAILMPESLSPATITQMQRLALETPRMERAVRVIVTDTKASPYAVESISNPMLSTTQAKLTDPAALKVAIDDARKRGGLLPLDESTSSKYATRAADLLRDIAINRSPVYDVAIAESPMQNALSDARPEIVKDAALVLGVLDGPAVQTALLSKATEEHEPDDLKTALFKALATNVRNFGGKLSQNDVDKVQTATASAPNLDVRTAAGEARGALNLPAAQAKTLIVGQMKVTTN